MNLIMLFAMLFVGYSSTAIAQSAATDADFQRELLHVLREAVAGHYAYAAALTLVVLVALARKQAARWEWLGSDQGGALLVLLGAFGGAVVAAASGTREVTWMLARDAAIVAFSASGGYSLLKRLLVTPYVVPLAARQDLLGSVARVIVWAFTAPVAQKV